MGGYYGGAYEEIARRGLVPVVYDASHVEGLARAARLTGEPVRAHLKVDTGMSRLGVRMADLERFAERLAAHPEVEITGLMTHLACADAGDDALTAEPIARFEEATLRLARAGIRPSVRHAANSAAVLRGRATFDAVRPGIAIFGVSPRAQQAAQAGDAAAPPAEGAPFTTELRAVMRVRSEIVDLRTVEAGEGVGYGALFRAAKTTRIATIPVGYADGLSRQLSNRGHVLIHGRRAPIVGAVSMDMSMIDVTDVPAASLRDEVVVLGSQEGASIAADELAAHAGTIPWEVLTSISRRVPRFYREP
jgi:alanine racemase